MNHFLNQPGLNVNDISDFEHPNWVSTWFRISNLYIHLSHLYPIYIPFVYIYISHISHLYPIYIHFISILYPIYPRDILMIIISEMQNDQEADRRLFTAWRCHGIHVVRRRELSQAKQNQKRLSH